MYLKHKLKGEVFNSNARGNCCDIVELQGKLHKFPDTSPDRFQFNVHVFNETAKFF